MSLLRYIMLALVGLSAGFVVAGGVFAFIAAIGIIPRLARRSKTRGSIRFYEMAVIIGGIFGATTLAVNYNIPLGQVGAVIFGAAYGVFLGCLAVCLAEILNVLPVMSRRAGLQRGLGFLLPAFALGKASGALIYFFVPGFNN